MLTLNRNKVRGRMHMRGYSTQDELAEALGISRVWLSSLLSGREQPSTDLMVKLCQVLDCAIDDIAEYPKAAISILDPPQNSTLVEFA